MKLKAKKDEHSSLGLEGTKEFSIDTDSGMIVSILRDKLYKNKVAAVCREIASNGRDANREAGRADVPVVIKIHDDTDLIGEGATLISFSDNGIGITPDRMGKIFLKYGGSTKRTSNKQTGGFGIGAKTPFAYTNNFLITTVAEVDGKKIEYIYQALIIGDGVKESSKLMLVTSEPTTKKTGTTITVPIGDSTSDFNLRERIAEFEWECIHATATWKVRPTFEGFTQHDNLTKDLGLEVVMKGKGWQIVKDPNNALNARRKLVASVDGIPYQIDSEEVKDATMAEKLQNFFPYYRDSYVPVISIKTGEVSLSASREDVEYTPENLKVISEKYKNLKDNLKEEALKCLKEAESKIEKSTIYIKIIYGVRDPKTAKEKKYNTLHYALGDMTEKIKNEEKLVTRLRELCPKHKFIKTYVSDPSHQSDIGHSNIDLELLKSMPIVFRNSNSDRQKNSTLQKGLKNGNKYVLFVIPPKDGRVYQETTELKENRKEFEKLLKEVNIKLIDYNTVEKDKTISRSYSTYDKEHDGSIGVTARIYEPNNCQTSDWASYTIETFKGKQEGKICGKKVLKKFDKNKCILLTVKGSITGLNKKSPNYGTIFGIELPEYIDNMKARHYYSNKNVVTKMLAHLKAEGYTFIAIPENKKKYFAKEKSIKTLKNIVPTFEKEYFTEEFKQGLIDYVNYQNSQEVDVAEYLHEVYAKVPKLLQLAGLDVTKVEEAQSVAECEETELANKLSNEWNHDTLVALHEHFKLEKKDFEVSVTADDIENAMAKLRNDHPAVAWLFEKLEDYYNWGYEKYGDTDSYNRLDNKQDGHAKILADAIELVDKLFPDGSIPEVKPKGKRGRPKGSKNKKK